MSRNVNNANSIKFGVGKLEFSVDNGSSFSNLGLVSAPTFTYIPNIVQFKAANGDLDPKASEERVNLAFNLYEAALDNLVALSAGLFTSQNSGGTLEEGASCSFAQGDWKFNRSVRIPKKNADGTAVAVNAVEGSVDGALVENTDYFIGLDTEGYTILTFIDDGALATTGEAQDISVTDYDVTEAEYKKLTAGGKTAITPFMLRLTIDMPNSKYLKILIYKSYFSGDISYNTQDDGSEEPNSVGLTFEGFLDDTREEGDQLFSMQDNMDI